MKKIIEDATKLAERSVVAFEAERRLKDIEPEFKKLSEKTAGLRPKVDALADRLITRGILDEDNKVAFVDSISDNPIELVEVAMKLSDQVVAEQFGKVASDSSDHGSKDLDPFERLAAGIY